ncbi:MAG: DUF4331 family protein [Bacteroidota bacterium]|nr:DUF4331 family protein [Bacteroidota bacterium]
MKKSFTISKLKVGIAVAAVTVFSAVLMSSSHREAPMISNDPLADNTDLYAFKSPNDPNKIVIIANYIPGQLPNGGPNYYSFGDDVRYEIHVDNDATKPGDEITYRFTFYKENQDPTTFFNIRLGKENLHTTYKLERSSNGGKTFEEIVSRTEGVVPPYNIGPRSISSPVGLNAPDYNSLIAKSIITAKGGEKVFAGTADDPFFVDLGGIFDLGNAPRQGPSRPEDALKCKNVSTLVLEIPIKSLQKNHKPLSEAKNILDPNYVIGVWASASRQQIRTLNGDGTQSNSGPWVQVSRLGMPLTNEAIIPIGYKDYWNSLTPYQDLSKLSIFGNFFYNPELALYMDDDQFGGAVPAFAPLRIQKKSLGTYNFSNGNDGLFGLKGNPALDGTALSEANFGALLLPAAKSPRSVDIWPIFHTGVPNMRPYQLATGKMGNPLAAGKPFVSNFLPNGGDMLRLNMAVPATKRDDPDFKSTGLLEAAALGLTDPRFNTDTSLQFIPNMDGFPNGRRLEDDVTRIELQAVSGFVLAGIGLFYDDYVPGGSPITPNLLSVYNYNTGVNANDTSFKTAFPFVQTPWSGDHNCDCAPPPQAPTVNMKTNGPATSQGLGLASPGIEIANTPNPVGSGNNTLRYHVAERSRVNIMLYDASGKPLKTLVNKTVEPGTYTTQWNASGMSKGSYFISGKKDSGTNKTITIVKE